MKPLLTKIKHRDMQAWKVTVESQQVGFIFKDRFSWGFCNARKGGFPKTWLSTDVKNQAEAVAKLIEWDAQAYELAARVLA